MKKLLTCAALLAVCAPAFTAEVESSNIVGYQKIALNANKMDILGQSFQTIGSESTSVQSIGVSGNFSEEGTDWIMVWDDATSSYTSLYYWGDSVDGVFTDDTYETSLGAGWGDPGQIVVNYTIPAGRGFWVNSELGGSLVFADPTAAAGE